MTHSINQARANITFADTLTKTVSIPESANFGTIFAFHLFRALDILLRAPFRFIFFPFAALCGITKAALGWYRLYHDHKDKKELDIKALIFTIWETINATVTTTAVILGAGSAIIGVSAATSAIIGMTISLMFTASLGISTLLNLSFFAYHLYNSYFNSALSPTEKAGHRAAAKGHAIGTVILALLTTSVVIAMVAGMLVMGGALGAATCLVAVGLGIQDLYYHWTKKEEPLLTTDTDKSPLLTSGTASTNTLVSKTLRASNASTASLEFLGGDDVMVVSDSDLSELSSGDDSEDLLDDLMTRSTSSSPARSPRT